MTSVPLRIAIGLSGGVDSSVVALVLSRCVKTLQDVRAITSVRAAPPSLETVMDGVRRGAPLSTWDLSLASAVRGPNPSVQLVPLYMKNWEDVDSQSGWCATATRDYDDATAVAHDLGLVPEMQSLRVVHLASEYAACCFDPMLDAFAKGRTLNVDVLCNEHIKFGHLWQRLHDPSTGALAADVLATGHYARTWSLPASLAAPEAGGALVQRPFTASTDLNDQTVFLSRVPPSVLRCALFPLGHLFASKRDVRQLARWWWQSAAAAAGAGTTGRATRLRDLADKKTSTGICFVGRPSTGGSASKELSFAQFLSDYVPPSTSTASAPGAAPLSKTQTEFVDADTGACVDPRSFTWSRSNTTLSEYDGAHLPAFAFTLGQKLLSTASPPTPARSGPSHLHRRYYVWKKELVPSSGPVTDASVARLARVWLVSRCDDPRLFSTRVHLRDVRLHVSLPSGRHDGSAQALRCWCCTRHQEKLRPALLRMMPHTGQGSVELDEPVRALTPGQALVVYVSPSQLSATTDRTDAPAHTSDSETLRDLVVVASGWVRDPQDGED